MGQSTIKNSRRIFTTAGGDPTLPDRVTYLENNEYKILYFQTISAATGTITKPTNSTILLDQFYEGGDAIVETLVNGQPSGQSPLTAGGAVVSVSSFDTSGNFTLSGTPTSFDVALVYILKIKAEDYQNLTIANIMAMEDLNPITQTITNGDTSHAPSSDAVYDALELKVGIGDARLTDTRINRAIFKQNTTLSHTGDTTNTLKYSSLIPAGTFEANDILKWNAKIGATSNANTKTIRYYFNTSASLSGATLVATYALSSGGTAIGMDRALVFANSLTSQSIGNPSAAFQSEYSALSAVPSTVSIDFTVDQYIIIAIQLNNATDTMSIFSVYSETYR